MAAAAAAAAAEQGVRSEIFIQHPETCIGCGHQCDYKVETRVPCVLMCEHILCRACVRTLYVSGKRRVVCPLCHEHTTAPCGPNSVPMSDVAAEVLGAEEDARAEHSATDPTAAPSAKRVRPGRIDPWRIVQYRTKSLELLIANIGFVRVVEIANRADQLLTQDVARVTAEVATLVRDVAAQGIDPDRIDALALRTRTACHDPSVTAARECTRIVNQADAAVRAALSSLDATPSAIQLRQVNEALVSVRAAVDMSSSASHLVTIRAWDTLRGTKHTSHPDYVCVVAVQHGHRAVAVVFPGGCVGVSVEPSCTIRTLVERVLGTLGDPTDARYCGLSTLAADGIAGDPACELADTQTVGSVRMTNNTLYVCCREGTVNITVETLDRRVARIKVDPERMSHRFVKWMTFRELAIPPMRQIHMTEHKACGNDDLLAVHGVKDGTCIHAILSLSPKTTAYA